MCQTAVLTMKVTSFYRLTQHLLTRAHHSMHFKGDPKFQSNQDLMDTTSLPPHQKRNYPGNVSTLGSFFPLFQLCFNVIEIYQNKNGKLFLKALHNRISYFFKNLYAVLIFQILIFCTPKTNTIFYVNYISICFKNGVE